MTPRQHPPESDDLVISAKQGSLEAFNSLYETYYPQVVKRVQYLVPAEDVEDVTQDVFIAVMRSLKSFRGAAKFSTWLRVLTNRQIADFYRRRKQAALPLHEGLRDPSPAHPADEVMILRQAFQRLPGKYREIILLRFAEDMPFGDIARLQNRSLEATKSLFRRAVAALSKLVPGDES